MKRLWSLAGCLLLAGFAISGCHRSRSPSVATTVDLDQAAYQITGPFTHENLSVFLVYSKTQDDRDFITLDQGLKEGMVTVSEKEQEQVSELQIENQSDQPLFLQEGDRLRGGKQDRTIIASLVIPPKSGKMPLPTFCIEQGRWVEGAGGKAFAATPNLAFAPKEVRAAAKISKDQGQVWEQVREERENLKRVVTTHSYSTSSLNEALDAPQARKISDDFAEALSGVPRHYQDAVGVAIAVNGTIEEINIYPNHQLLAKLYPRLLQSYALQATAEKDKAKDAKSVSPEEVAQFMKTDGKEKSKRTDKINPDNRLEIAHFEGACRCATEYNGVVVHRQVMRENPATAAGLGGNDGPMLNRPIPINPSEPRRQGANPSPLAPPNAPPGRP
jgi:hypothetical protein